MANTASNLKIASFIFNTMKIISMMLEEEEENMFEYG